MNLIRQLRRRNIRTSAESSLQAAASVPNSGFTFVDNSQGASAAVSELSKALDIALDNVEFGGTVRLHVVHAKAMLRISQQISANCCRPSWIISMRKPKSTQILRLQAAKLRLNGHGISFKSVSTYLSLTDLSNQSEAEVISIAWKCALAVYNPTCAIRSETVDFKVQDYVVPSAGGSTKAVSFTLVNRTVSPDETNPFFPVLVVAVRGTASIMDGMVNANNQARDASKLFVCIALPSFLHR